MAAKIRIRFGQPVGLHLTVEDRQALLEMGVLEGKLHETIQQASAADQNLMFTLAELSLLSRHVAAGIGRTKDRRLCKKLDRIIDRIGRLTQTFEEE
ncbi:MAG: hypothetical protein NT031_15630 [Planctomycetota bacterium]|nr:hypothetical protein [Planctomycetota bacterium]